MSSFRASRRTFLAGLGAAALPSTCDGAARNVLELTMLACLCRVDVLLGVPLRAGVQAGVEACSCHAVAARDGLLHTCHAGAGMQPSRGNVSV